MCHNETETLIHLFIKCPIVTRLWEQVQEYIQRRFKIFVIDISPTTVVLNSIVSKKWHAANFICLLTKQYIYAQRCLGRDINFLELKAKIRTAESLEKYIAIKNERLSKHQKKWGILEQSQSMDLNNFELHYIEYM